MRILLLSLLVATAIPTLRAQKDKPLEIKYGKLEPGEMDLMPSGKDAEAEAYVLYDRTVLDIDLNSDNMPFRQRRVHRRTKLIRESSFDRATVEIYFRPKTERILNLDACIFTAAGQRIKLKKSDFVKDKYNDDVSFIKFTFPGVSEGCIIEYQYIENSEQITVPNRFQFQEDVPVRYVEYKSYILDMFRYVNMGNAQNFQVKEFDAIPRMVGIQRHKRNMNTMGFYDLPAYEHQPYVNNFQDYLPYVQYQLRSFHPDNGMTQMIFSDWATTIKEMDGWGDFGRAYQANGMSNAVWKTAEPMLAGLTTEGEKAEALYKFVSSNVTWNEKYDWTSDNSPDKVFSSKTGDTAEMTFMLLALLRQAGIESYPALVSLRDRGAPIQVYPIMSQFEHVMTYAKLDGEWVFLDVEAGKRPVGLVRAAALNGQVMIADPNNPRWVDIPVPTADRTIMAKMQVDAEGMATVDLQSRMNSYYAYNGKVALSNNSKDADYPIAKEVMVKFPEAELLDKEVGESKQGNNDLYLNMKMKVAAGQVVDDFMYLQPILVDVLSKELADSEQRLYPVDFNYPWLERFFTTITPPEGYVIDELPETLKISSEDNSLVCLIRAQESSTGDINVELRVEASRTFYSAHEYGVLKELFARIIESQNATIVLKKAK